MQLAGTPCGLCQSRILLDGDATWCARCKTVLHHICLTQAESVCPKCLEPYDKPETYFKLSEFCPECMRENDPPAERCSRCHTATRWDTADEYEAFLGHMKDSAAVSYVQGAIELGVGLFCLGGSALILASRMASWRTLFGTVMGFLVLIPKGIADLLKGNRYRRFR